ncbi:autolysin [Aspergillus lentulus]|uniref:autolysin n=1 Tax=Aspergillus lentulus TaxID=293939 RepID=UPI001393A508|nr:autolysin [Aspergillus lentulus]GFF48500.1 autolysin [Aspergillus lentulus]
MRPSFYQTFLLHLTSGFRSVLASPALWAGTTIPGATVTKTGVHATETVAPPGPVAFGTTPKCGKCYQVNKGDYCQLIALNFTITVSLFEAINPQIDAGCSNLSPGLYYCVLPTADWNQTTTTTTSSYQTAPAPAPSGTTGNCYEWYVVQSGDYCAKIESVYGITMAQLQQWNPDLKDDCSNLQLNDAYCVHAGAGGGTTPGNMAVRVRAFPTSP